VSDAGREQRGVSGREADAPPVTGSGHGAVAAPAGVRPVSGNVGNAASSPGSSRLRWVDPGPFALAHGDRVVVLEDGSEWLGEVTLAPERLVAWPDDLSALPVIARRASAAEWPDRPVTDGRRLLESLALPPELL
jgi:hypothetical protein